jgi:hypothetical protein
MGSGTASTARPAPARSAASAVNAGPPAITRGGLHWPPTTPTVPNVPL